MKKNLLISTGGSGGHVVPATILHEHLVQDANVIFSTDIRGLRYLNENDFKIDIINTPKLNNLFFLPFNLIKILFLIFKSILILKKREIKTVFSTGGYMSLPLILAAKLMKLDIYLLEPNQVLGRANKFYLNFSKKIFCYSEKIKYFPDKFSKKIVTINPLVRKNNYTLKCSSKKKDKFTLLIVGGSQGANIFDKDLKYSIVNISKKIQIRIIQQTNETNINKLKDFYSKNNIESKIFSYDKNFVNKVQESDICITRAGASTLAELSIINIPFIAVPLPSSKDNHQLENANFYKDQGCCWVIEQDNFEKKIEELLMIILSDKRGYIEKKENLKKLNLENTWTDINRKILRVINEN